MTIRSRIALLTGLVLLTCTQFAMAEQSSPTSCYQAYFAKFTDAKNFSDIAEFSSARAMTSMNKLDESGRDTTLKLEKWSMPDTVKVISESVSGAQATLKVQGSFTGARNRLGDTKPSDDPSKAVNNLVPQVGQTVTGTISMVLEDGTWKVDKEAWGTVQMVTTKLLSAKGQALQHGDSARQTVTKYVNGNVYDKTFGLVKSRYSYVSLLLDGGEIPNVAVVKFRAKVIIEFATPQNFPGQTYRITPGQQLITTKGGTIKPPTVYLCEERGKGFVNSLVGNSTSAMDQYSLVLNFYQMTKDGQLPGYIDLQVPGKDNTHIKGYFYATKTGKISSFGND